MGKFFFAFGQPFVIPIRSSNEVIIHRSRKSGISHPWHGIVHLFFPLILAHIPPPSIKFSERAFVVLSVCLQTWTSEGLVPISWCARRDHHFDRPPPSVFEGAGSPPRRWRRMTGACVSGSYNVMYCKGGICRCDTIAISWNGPPLYYAQKKVCPNNFDRQNPPSTVLSDQRPR